MFDVIVVGYKAEARLTGVGKYTDSLINMLREECGYCVGIIDIKGANKLQRLLYKILILPAKLLFSDNAAAYIISDESMFYLRLFLFRKKVGVVIHDRRGYSLFRNGYASYRDLLSYIQGSIFIPTFDFVLTVSDFTRKLISHEHTVVLPNVFPPGPDTHGTSRIIQSRADLTHHISDAYILYVGSGEARKNFDMAADVGIAVYKKYGIKILVVGMSMNSKYYTRFKTNPAFEFRFFVSNIELDCLYQNALCLLNTSLFEGFGRVVIEAQLNCCPVISTLNSSLVEVLKDSALEIKSYYKVEDIVKLIESLFDSSTAERIVYNGIQNSSRFTYDVVRQQSNVIKMLIDKK